MKYITFAFIRQPNQTMIMNVLPLEKQYDFYVSHEDELLAKYNGMHLVISDDLCVMAFVKPQDAFAYGEEHYGLGHFLLQKCTPGVLQVVNSVNCALA